MSVKNIHKTINFNIYRIIYKKKFQYLYVVKI